MRRRPTDAERIWEALCAAPYSLHSFDIRARLHSGNPSQRIAEIERDRGVAIPRHSEARNGRNGVRYFHPDHPPGPEAGGTAAHPGCPEDLAAGSQPAGTPSGSASAAGPGAAPPSPEPVVTPLFAAEELRAPRRARAGGSYRDPDAEGPAAA